LYRIRTPGYSKDNLEQRWALPDRVFFACGACHILAHAFVERYRAAATRVVWIKPNSGFAGNHILVVTPVWAFDYHGYSELQALLDHTWKRARHFWPGWDASLVELPRDVLVSESKSRSYDGLWLREPCQFRYDALPRAHAYLDRFPAPSEAAAKSLPILTSGTATSPRASSNRSIG
jgi:hypothetical protein